MNICKICDSTEGNKTHKAREMMFGTREHFTYLECGRCGCLQLLDIPADMAKHYPKDYYSYAKHGRIMTFLRHRWSAYALGSPSIIGWALTRFKFPNRGMMAVRRVGIAPETRVLDVGCGSGNLLQDLKHLGYPNVTGVDPFISKDIEYPGGPTIYKRQLSEMHGEYDLIMLHHAFEHMDKPGEVLQALAARLAPKGSILIRIPVAGAYAWKHYGINWVHLDAPRHFYLHTPRSMEILAQRSGLKVTETIQEADEGTFWASEAYAKDISASDPRYPTSKPFYKILHWKTDREYRMLADELNRKEDADLLCFNLTRAS